MEFSLTLVDVPVDQYGPVAEKAEQLGYQAVWIPEHVLIPKEISPNYPYKESGEYLLPHDSPFVDPLVMIGHLSGRTTKIMLGTGMYILPLRNPFVAAKAIATAQQVSHDRVILGVGLGWMREEFDIIGEAFDRRGVRADEMLEVMKKLWTGNAVEHHGEWYKFKSVQMAPGLKKSPQIVFGGTSTASIKRVVRFGDGWYAPPIEIDGAVALRTELIRALDSAGRGVDRFPIWVRVPQPTSPEFMIKLRDAHFDRLVVQMPTTLGLSARLEWLEQIAEYRKSLN